MDALTRIAVALDVSLDSLLMDEDRSRDDAANADISWDWETDPDLRTFTQRTSVALWQRHAINPSLPWSVVNAMMRSRKPIDNLNFSCVINGHLAAFEVKGDPTYDDDGAFAGYKGVARELAGLERERYLKNLKMP